MVVIDCRHNFNGLGDTHERLNFLLRVGRSLGRAAFLWTDTGADAEGPQRAPHKQAERVVRPYLTGSFDPGAYVTGFGDARWRWSKSRREAAEKRHPGMQWLFLHYECMRFGDGGCVHVELRLGENATVVVDAQGSAKEVADAVLSALNDRFRDYPLLRLQVSVQGDLTMESRIPWVCPRGLDEPLREHCDQSCESFLNWRPSRRTWVAMRPHLQAIDAWRAVVGLTVRTGAADHFGALPEVLGRTSQPGSGLVASDLATRLEVLFTPCPEGTAPMRRDKQKGEPQCVHWRSDDPSAPPPSMALAALCGGSTADASGPPLFNESTGPFGAFIDCAARAAQGLAADSGDAEARDAWGVMLFSDSPATKCVLEASGLAASGHAHVTPTAPGHVQYAPAGDALRSVGRMTIVDWYIIGLVDWQLVVLGSAFGGSTNVRRKVSPRQPPGSGLDAMRRGFERWFEVGRENYAGRGVDVATLELLSTTVDGCPLTQTSNRRMYEQYLAAPPDARYEG